MPGFTGGSATMSRTNWWSGSIEWMLRMVGLVFGVVRLIGR